MLAPINIATSPIIIKPIMLKIKHIYINLFVYHYYLCHDLTVVKLSKIITFCLLNDL